MGGMPLWTSIALATRVWRGFRVERSRPYRFRVAREARQRPGTLPFVTFGSPLQISDFALREKRGGIRAKSPL